MPRRLRTAALAGVLAASMVGCESGDEGTIPSDESDAMIRLLDAIESDVAAGDCELAEQHISDLVGTVNALPAEVDAEVEQGLSRASANLVELVEQPGACESATGASGEDEDEPAADTTSVPETTAPPSTTEPPTTDEEDSEPKPEPEPEPEPEAESEPPDNAGEGGPPVEVPGEGDPGGGRGAPSSGGVSERGGASG